MDNDRIIIRDKYGHSKSVQTLQPKTAKDLMETEIVKPDEIVKGLLPVGASILAGEPKCGKSFIVMQMVLAVASGMPFLGMETQKCRVLYCDLESPNWLHQQRLELLCNDESSLDNIDIITQSDREAIGTLGEGFEDQLLSYLESHMDCKLIVIDTLGEIMTSKTVDEIGNGGQYAKEKEAYDRLIALARNRQVAIVVIDHTTKTVVDKDVFRSIRGTYATSGSYDTLMVLSIPKQEGDRQNKRIRRLSVKGKAVAEQDICITLDENWEIEGASTSLQYEQSKKERVYKSCDLAKYLKVALSNEGKIRGSASDILEILRAYGYIEDITPDALGKWLMSYKTIMMDVDNVLFTKKRIASKRIMELRYGNEEAKGVTGRSVI